ncbi:MAG TPA: HDIG domain-containing protein [Clostridiales bacterium]|jgi:putative nucleotidyltransferase with HDIG domain|nr:HDIG domain-containing protein [Clostridiales bacterium]
MIRPAAVRRNKPVGKKPFFRFLLHPFFADAVIGLAVFGLIFALVFTAVSPERYELKAGDIPSEPIAAPRDVEDEKATLELMEQARMQVNDIYTLDHTITAGVVAETEEIFAGMELVRNQAEEKLHEWEEEQREQQRREEEQRRQQEQQEEQLEQPEGRTQSPDNPDGTAEPDESGQETQEATSSEIPEPDLNELYNQAFLRDMQQHIPIQLSNDDIRSIILAEQRDLNQLHQKLTETLQEMMGAGIKQEQLAEFKANLRDSIQGMAVSNELKLLGTNIGVPRLKANLLYDRDKTMAEKNKAAESVEKVIYKKGQFIVQAGQPVTESQIDMLSELGLLKDYRVDIPLIAGVALVVLISIAIGVIYLIFYEKELLYQPHLILMSGIILTLVAALAYAAALFNPYLMPSAMAGILLAVLINTRMGMIINIVMALLAGLLSGMQIAPVAMTLAGGMVGIGMLKSIQQRNSLVWAGIGIAGGNLLTIAAYEMLIQGGWLGPLTSSVWGILAGFVAAILTIGTLPIWENLFDVVTPIKLVELGNPNNDILKRLLMETPGTYHHSIIVANLAESAAEAIGANGLLARVGAYYHDVGKLERPYFFKENQLSIDNPHDELEPGLSTKIITSHVTDGLELAKKYKVPAVIQEFITEHHGTTPVVYFFHKARKQENGEPKLEDFRYPGPRPRSRETAIVMLADTAEAAVRSMTEHTPDKVEALIRKLIREKLDDGQFDDCNLTLRDMNTIATTFTGVFSGIFHERVKYPNVNLKEERADKKDGFTD